MKYFIQKELTPLKGILVLMLLALAGMLVFLSLATLINMIAFDGFNPSDSSSEQGLMGLRIIQIFQTFGMFMFPAIAIALFTSTQPIKYLGLNQTTGTFIVYSIVLLLVFIPGINFIASLNAQIPLPSWMIEMEQNAAILTKKMLVTDNFSTMALNFFVVAIMPALAEELFFRGLLQKYLVKWTGKTFWGVLLAATVFSAIHMQFQGFVPRLLLGMVFGYLYVWSGSIWAPIAAHLANNGLAVVAYFLIGREVIPSNLDTFGNASDMWQAGVMSLLLTAIMLWVVWKNRIRHLNQSGYAPTSEAP